MAIATFHEFASRDELTARLADDVVKNLDPARSTTLAVSGGSTPKLLFSELAKRNADWSNVTILPVDERDVSPEHERSNEKMIRQTLIKDAAENASFHPLRVNGSGILEINDDLAMPPDVCLLGMGTDGHTASWFPNADRLTEAVDPHGELAAMAISAPGADEPRFTLTHPIVAKAGFLALHIEGEAKRDALKLARKDGPSEDMPIRYLLRDPQVDLHIYWAP